MKSALVVQSQRGEAFIAKNQTALVTMIVRDQQQAAFIAKGVRATVSKPVSHCVHVSRDDGAAVILAGQRGGVGLQGIPGPAGGAAVQRTYGETISALLVVYELNGQVFLLDYRDGEHIDLALGVSLNTGLAGQQGNIQRSGVIDDSSWTWTPGPVWLGADGALTQVSPVDGYNVSIGSANSPSRITLNLQEPISLE